MRTQAIHLTMEECALMCNLLHAGMQATKKPFEEQPLQVKVLSTKLANSYKTHERKLGKQAKTVFDK